MCSRAEATRWESATFIWQPAVHMWYFIGGYYIGGGGCQQGGGEGTSVRLPSALLRAGRGTFVGFVDFVGFVGFVGY
jgi:hypothetical protein